jgi:hypothetical protein
MDDRLKCLECASLVLRGVQERLVVEGVPVWERLFGTARPDDATPGGSTAPPPSVTRRDAATGDETPTLASHYEHSSPGALLSTAATATSLSAPSGPNTSATAVGDDDGVGSGSDAECPTDLASLDAAAAFLVGLRYTLRGSSTRTTMRQWVVHADGSPLDVEDCLCLRRLVPLAGGLIAAIEDIGVAAVPPYTRFQALEIVKAIASLRIELR